MATCFSLPSSRSAAVRICIKAASFFPSAYAVQAVAAVRWISTCCAQEPSLDCRRPSSICFSCSMFFRAASRSPLRASPSRE